MDKVTQVLIDALKQALAEPGEQRLYRAGKFPGVFPSRVGLNAEAASRAFRDGLLEVTRTEVTKGKVPAPVEFVRVTPKGVEFIHENESPVRAMTELRAVLQANQDGIPAWLADVRKELNELGQRLTQEVQAITHRLDTLSQRVIESLSRHHALLPTITDDTKELVPWAQAALDFLEQHRASGVINNCALPDLYRAVREQQAELTVPDFHAGLRRLHDRGVLRLLAADDPQMIQEPEYALPGGPGAGVYYYVAR